MYGLLRVISITLFCGSPYMLQRSSAEYRSSCRYENRSTLRKCTLWYYRLVQSGNVLCGIIGQYTIIMYSGYYIVSFYLLKNYHNLVTSLSKKYTLWYYRLNTIIMYSVVLYVNTLLQYTLWYYRLNIITMYSVVLYVNTLL